MDALEQFFGFAKPEIPRGVNPNDFAAIIDNRLWVNIKYDDGKKNPASGSRLCKIVAWGMSVAGNECIRVYENVGDSRSGGIPDYRLMLTRRIKSISVAENIEPWKESDLDSRYNWSGDRGMSVVFYNYQKQK